MNTAMQQVNFKLWRGLATAVIAGALLLANSGLTMAQRDEPAPVTAEKEATVAGDEAPPAQIDAELTAKIVESTQPPLKALGDAAGAEGAEKVFAEFPLTELGEAVQQADYARGFNLYLQCWDGVLVLRAFDDNGICIPPVSGGGDYGEIRIGTCRGHFWSVQLLRIP